MSNIVSNSFVVLSDFHAMDWPVDKISDYYLKEYDKIFILGDACDRGVDGNGKNSFNVLNNIYELAQKYPGRVVYIPGNHDQMLYNAVNGDECALNNLLRNGGKDTYGVYENRYSRNSEIPAHRIERLVEWVGEQPIQFVHNYNGQKYVLAHAFFNQKFYDQNPNFCFKDFFNMMKTAAKCPIGSQERDKIINTLLDVDNILWFRKVSSKYNAADLPNDNSIMVIGHTPEQARAGVDLDLKNANGNVIRVHCVDGGIAYVGNMLKYDGGMSVIRTKKHGHNDTSPKQPTSVGLDDKYFKYVFGEEGRKLLNDVIIGTLRSCDASPAETYDNLNKFMTSLDVNLLPNIPGLRDKAKEISPYIAAIVFQQRANGNTTIWNESFLTEYVGEVALDHIITSTIERFGTTNSAVNALVGLFKEKNFTYITESVGNARTVAMGMGIENMKNVIRKNGCNYVSEYVEKKFGVGASQK